MHEEYIYTVNKLLQVSYMNVTHKLHRCYKYYIHKLLQVIYILTLHTRYIYVTSVT
jgi:hypothetical protein